MPCTNLSYSKNKGLHCLIYDKKKAHIQLFSLNVHCVYALYRSLMFGDRVRLQISSQLVLPCLQRACQINGVIILCPSLGL